MFFLCLLLNWIYLGHLTKVGDEKRSPSWVMAVEDVVNMMSRHMDLQWINVIGLNLCLVFKKIHKLYLCDLCANENQALAPLIQIIMTRFILSSCRSSENFRNSIVSIVPN